MANALIGSTGFVGQTLLSQQPFDAAYHSTDIERIEGCRFDTIICAGVTAVKWWANQNAEEDLRRINLLIRHLERVDCGQFTLISTVDVYAAPQGVSESDPVGGPGLHPYGANRAVLEAWAARRFNRCNVVRLPALFGKNLKKNALYDLLNDNRLAHVDHKSLFQWYPLTRLSDDIDVARRHALPVINLVSEPISMEVIQARFFPGKRLGGMSQQVAYDVQTDHAGAYGEAGRYMMQAEAVLDAMAQFVAESARL